MYQQRKWEQRQRTVLRSVDSWIHNALGLAAADVLNGVLNESTAAPSPVQGGASSTTTTTESSAAAPAVLSPVDIVGQPVSASPSTSVSSSDVYTLSTPHIVLAGFRGGRECVEHIEHAIHAACATSSDSNSFADGDITCDDSKSPAVAPSTVATSVTPNTIAVRFILQHNLCLIRAPSRTAGLGIYTKMHGVPAMSLQPNHKCCVYFAKRWVSCGKLSAVVIVM